MSKRSSFPGSRASSNRAFPTLRQMLRSGRKGGGKFRAPWYDGFPNRGGNSWANSLRRKG